VPSSHGQSGCRRPEAHSIPRSNVLYTVHACSTKSMRCKPSGRHASLGVLVRPASECCRASQTLHVAHTLEHNVLITGGAGFIGSFVADELLAYGHRVRILDSLVPQ